MVATITVNKPPRRRSCRTTRRASSHHFATATAAAVSGFRVVGFQHAMRRRRAIVGILPRQCQGNKSVEYGNAT